MQELKGYLREGTTLDELWKVANGEIKYADFMRNRQRGDGGAPPQELPPLPESLVRCFQIRL